MLSDVFLCKPSIYLGECFAERDHFLITIQKAIIVSHGMNLLCAERGSIGSGRVEIAPRPRPARYIKPGSLGYIHSFVLRLSRTLTRTTLD